jgi:hypothetical protein
VPAPGHVTLVLWHWPLGETISRGAWSGLPLPDVNHPMSKFRFLVDCPEAIAEAVVRATPLCHRLDDERA